MKRPYSGRPHKKVNIVSFRTLTYRNRLTHAVSLALLATALPVIAQQAPTTADELDRIVVTAQKREQQLLEVPLAVTAYSGEFIEKLGVTGIGDLANYVPGLQVQEQNPNNPG